MEAIKEAEEAALAEAEAAAVEAAQAMEGLFGDDPSGPDPGGGARVDSVRLGAHVLGFDPRDL